MDLVINDRLPAAFGETDRDALARALQAISVTLDDTAEQSKVTAIASTADTLGAATEAALTNLGPGFGQRMKQAAAEFLAQHPGENLTDLAQVLPYLQGSGKLFAALRPIFAQVDFAHDHGNRLPTSPAELQPYLARPFVPAEALRALKLKREGDDLDLTVAFPFGSDGKP